jgi:hypothetical protein
MVPIKIPLSSIFGLKYAHFFLEKMSEIHLVDNVASEQDDAAPVVADVLYSHDTVVILDEPLDAAGPGSPAPVRRARARTKRQPYDLEAADPEALRAALRAKLEPSAKRAKTASGQKTPRRLQRISADNDDADEDDGEDDSDENDSDENNSDDEDSNVEEDGEEDGKLWCICLQPDTGRCVEAGGDARHAHPPPPCAAR